MPRSNNRAQDILNLISESVSFVKPEGRGEHSEVLSQIKAHKSGEISLNHHTYKHLQHLSDPKNYDKALASSRMEKYTPEKVRRVENTDAAIKGSFTSLEPEKKGHVKAAYKNGTVTTPLILRHKETGHEHLLFGNTRLTYGLQKKKKPVSVSVVEY